MSDGSTLFEIDRELDSLLLACLAVPSFQSEVSTCSFLC